MKLRRKMWMMDDDYCGGEGDYPSMQAPGMIQQVRKVTRHHRHHRDDGVSEASEEDPGWHLPDWEWTCYDEYYNRRGDLIERRKRDHVKDEVKKHPFEVVYSNYQGMPWPERILITVHSKVLRVTLQKIWPHKQKLRLKGRAQLQGKDLFSKLEMLKQNLDPEVDKLLGTLESSDGQRGQVHLFHLIRCIEREFSETRSEHERMKDSGRVSFEMLWTFMQRGENVVYPCTLSEEEVCGRVKNARYDYDQQSGKWFLGLKLDEYNYNCESYQKASSWRRVYAFEDEKPFHKLEAYPYRYTENAPDIERRLLAQGALYGYLSALVKYRYMQYKGAMYEYVNVGGCNRIVKHNADGRVMVDTFNFSRMSSSAHTIMRKAYPPSKVSRSGLVRSVDISQDPNRIYSPAVVFGFSFRLKRWGCFSVHGFSEVVFDGGSSWDLLVMEPMLKQTTELLVAQHLTNFIEEGKGLDPIADKGNGCTIICYGPPGTGKTLTAESLAEKLRAPLWSMSVSELGITPHDLEERLVTTFEIAASWKTVLLLDEADVYLEKRTTKDTIRNAMCGIFLRHIEYYRGVLLLTTNRIPTFDEAFRSRISIFLRYPPLSTAQRQTIWRSLLGRAELREEASAEEELVREMADHQLNGREVRNAIQNAATLARALKEPLGSKHVKDATNVLIDSLEEVARLSG